MAKTVLNRTTFRTSREMDFFSEKELTTQTGHGIKEWPYVTLKELVDNSLDACEEADIAPEITVTADSGGITVSDNGPGIPESTIAGSLDFAVRCSNREMYVAPDRGAQGNALMTLLSMPRVIDPDHGCLVIVSHGVRHEIVCRADPISQRAMVVDEKSTNGDAEPGTTVRIQWSEHMDDDGDTVWPFGPRFHPINDAWGGQSRMDQFLVLARGYSFFNPHLTLTVNWFGEDILKVRATNPEWKKWKPNRPTSPHWYEQRHLERLIGAYITHDQDDGEDRTVATFLAEFDGLTGSQKRKRVLDETGLSRVKLSTLATHDALRSDLIVQLLESMKRHTNEVKAARLGIIGREHLSKRLEEMGGDPEQYEYCKIARVDNGLPFVLETAFSWLGNDAPDRRQIFAGANWSAGIKNPFRSFGATGEGLGELLQEQKAGAQEPIVFLMHVAHPRIEYTDRGKSAIVI
jgi:DNA topoisomerase VI subunit B